MREIIPKSLYALAKACPVPLYVVGGSVRDHLANLSPYPSETTSQTSNDWDICAPLSADSFSALATANGFSVKSVYRNTGTVKLKDESGVDYEYTCFRSDKYVRGEHVPIEIHFTDDIVLDAKRRDFTANAVYYDITKEKFNDPLGGIQAIREKRLTTVASADKVFGEDGLRLMRLARQAAQLGFTPDKDCIFGATKNAALIQDISPERIYTELSLLLSADTKYGNKQGPYQGLLLLEKIGVLDFIFPELTLGRNMGQRADFHAYDVLNHSLRAVLYADKEIRLAALLHDVGKPACMLREGNAYDHPTEGAELSQRILLRLKVPKKLREHVCELVRYHMYDFDCKVKESKLRRFFIEHNGILKDLIKLKQADFSACKDDVSKAPTIQKWEALLQRMQGEKVPFTLRDLACTGKDLLEIGIQPSLLSNVLHQLLLHTSLFPKENEKARLCRLALSFAKALNE